jgi:hypothetical protein
MLRLFSLYLYLPEVWIDTKTKEPITTEEELRTVRHRDMESFEALMSETDLHLWRVRNNARQGLTPRYITQYFINRPFHSIGTGLPVDVSEWRRTSSGWVKDGQSRK